MKTFSIKDNDISDGSHTFAELYEHRCLLFLALCLERKSCCVWKIDPDAPGWFILYWESCAGQISYHMPEKFLRFVENTIRRQDDYLWDGHTSADVLNRLEEVCE